MKTLITLLIGSLIDAIIGDLHDGIVVLACACVAFIFLRDCD